MNPELIYKYLENTATDDQMRQVLDWLDADPAHMRELDELDKVMAASVIYGPDVLSPAPAKKAARRISLGRIPLRRIVRYAAELAAVAVVGIGVARMLADDRIEEWTRRTTALEVPAGQYLSMELQDGTKVWLNAGTRLEYPLVFAGGERRVKVAGEAMFDVEHDPAHPFVVETFACDVEVLGTKFDVMAEEPPRPDHPLLTAKNCLITPHIAWASREARLRLIDAVAGNLRAFLAGQPVNVVS